MKDAATYLHLGDEWHIVDAAGVGLKPAKAYPNIDQPVWVIDSFSNASVGVARLQGKAVHAPALIERKVRSEGLVDGESRVLIHRQIKEADGLQVLYTAVPLESWQQVMGWAGKQKDHCLVLPLAALASAGVAKGEGRVLRLGRQLIYFAYRENGFVQAMVTAYSETIDDLLIATRSLAEQACKGCGGHRVRVTWYSLSARQDEEEQLLRCLGERIDCSVALSPMMPLAVDGEQRYSALPYLLQQRRIMQAINPVQERLAAGAEQLLPMGMVAATVIALGLVTLGTFAHWQAHSESESTEHLLREASQREQTAQAVAARTLPAGYVETQAFIDGLHAQDVAYNPAHILAILRTAAGSEVRILRARWAPAEVKPALQPNLPGAQPIQIPAGVVIDGLLREGVEPAALTRFLLKLREFGYAATPLDPADGGQNGGFSYRLNKKDTEGAAT